MERTRANFPVRIRRHLVLCTLLWITASVARADVQSLGPQGINAVGLDLTGAGVAIGQVESGRPSVPGYDDPANSNPAVAPTEVVIRTTAAPPDTGIDEHALNVAGVMISTSELAPGVAPAAELNAGGYGLANETSALLTMQQVASMADDRVSAINMSFGLEGVPNGTSTLSRGTDWLTWRHDVLFVESGVQDDLTNFRPKDAFNNLVVGRLKTDDSGQFNQVSPENTSLALPGGRTRPDLVAPADAVLVPASGGGFSVVSGSSFSAPMVTGTVALLQQYAARQIALGNSHFNSTAQNHNVMKAVLMNSADKVADSGDGLRLGMQKTIVDTQGHDWTQSIAYSSLDIPLDDEMGVGALDATRAVQQLAGGGWHSGHGAVASTGWDLTATRGAGDFQRYEFADPLVGGSFISATLTWDHQVQLADINLNKAFDPGETFFDLGITNLDLYLMPKGATTLSQMVWGSLASNAWNVEHLFFQIPTTGEYELWVYQQDSPHGGQPYALAWQAVLVPEPRVTLDLAFALALGMLVWRWRRGGNRQVLARHVPADAMRNGRFPRSEAARF